MSVPLAVSAALALVFPLSSDHGVSWQEMGLVNGVRLRPRVKPAPVNKHAVLNLRSTHLDVDWREMGLATQLKVRGGLGNACTEDALPESEPAVVHAEPVEKRVPKKLQLPDLGDAVGDFVGNAKTRRSGAIAREIQHNNVLE